MYFVAFNRISTTISERDLLQESVVLFLQFLIYLQDCPTYLLLAVVSFFYVNILGLVYSMVLDGVWMCYLVDNYCVKFQRDCVSYIDS